MTLCTSAHCRTPDAIPEGDGRLCDGCLDRLWTTLRWAEFHLATLSPVKAVRPEMVATAGGFESASPANDSALVLLDLRSAPRGVGRSLTGPDDDDTSLLSAPAVLGGWARQVWEERTPPSLRRLIPAPATVRDAVSALLSALPWIAEQDWVGDFEDEVGQLNRQLRGVNGEAPPAPVATCTELLGDRPATAEDTRPVCGGDIVMWKHDRVGSLPPVVGARCLACARKYTGFELIDLAKRKAGTT